VSGTACELLFRRFELRLELLVLATKSRVSTPLRREICGKGAQSARDPLVSDGWQDAWFPLLARRQVIIVMDCDEQGRTAAAAIANRLSSISDARAIDLAPDRNDGYDLTDLLLDGERIEAVWP
jgi:hypothetical protein